MSTETVTVPRWAVDALINGGRLCGVCLGTSPQWDGHDVNPPCEGYARQVLAEVVNA